MLWKVVKAFMVTKSQAAGSYFGKEYFYVAKKTRVYTKTKCITRSFIYLFNTCCQLIFCEFLLAFTCTLCGKNILLRNMFFFSSWKNVYLSSHVNKI